MAIYVKKNRADILRGALRKLETSSGIRAIAPGSIARAFAEGITTEIGDLYDALDFNVAQSVLSTASGRSLDLLGALYNVTRRTLSQLASIDAQLGSFYFYIDAPTIADITIPAGTNVFTATDNFIGSQLSYSTLESVTIQAGRVLAYASIKPNFSDSIVTAGIGTLTSHNFLSPAGSIVRCTNPKTIAPQPGYETDDDYRLRIIKSIRVSSSGTFDAVRFAALSVFGVRDAKIRSTPYGLGSFEVIVTPEDNNLSQTVISNTALAIDKVRPVGVRMYLKLPDTKPIDISVSLILVSGLTTQQTTIATNRVNNSIVRYLNTLLAGDVLVYNKLIQVILDSSESVQDVQITRYAPNGIETVRRNFSPAEFEQVIPGRIEVTVA